MSFSRILDGVGDVCLLLQMLYWMACVVGGIETLRRDLANDIAIAFDPAFGKRSYSGSLVTVICSLEAIALPNWNPAVAPPPDAPEA